MVRRYGREAPKIFSSAENVFLNSRIANVVFLSSPLPLAMFFLACCQHRSHNESVTASLLAEDKRSIEGQTDCPWYSVLRPLVSLTFCGIWAQPSTSLLQKFWI